MVSDIFSKTTGGQLEVKARRKLKDAAAFEAFVEELQNQLVAQKELEPEGVVTDFDVSQNPITVEQFEALFATLTLGGVKILRMRLFGCPALNDEAMTHVSSYFQNELTNESSPLELHLSDCALQTDGFLLLMNAIEEGQLYPTTIAHGRSTPLYLRLENNYIEESIIQEKIDAGIVRIFKKGVSYNDDGVMVNLVAKWDGNLQQKEGEPPAPEDAPPPKEVHDPNKNWNNNWGGDWRQGQNQGWKSGGSQWRPKTQQPGPRPQQPGPRPQVIMPRMAVPGTRPPINAAGGSRAPAIIRPQTILTPRTVPARAVPAQTTPARVIPARTIPPRTVAAAGPRPVIIAPRILAPRGTSGTASDRSRTPVVRPHPPSGPPPSKESESEIPSQWEEHWSDEHGIPYYWNSETGEAIWDKPDE